MDSTPDDALAFQVDLSLYLLLSGLLLIDL